MTGFLDDEIKYDTKFSELIKTLAEKRKYRSHWKWLHDQLLFWVKKLNESELFKEKEIETILGLLIPFLYQICDQHKADSKNEFINSIENDIKSRYAQHSDWQWKYLLNEEKKEVTSETDVNDIQDLESSQKSPELVALSPDVEASEEFRSFLRKIHYLLDLLMPNNFQYTIYKSAFASNKTFDIRDYIFEYPLYFPTQYYKSVIEEKRHIAAKARITRTLKKEDDLNVQVGEVQYVVKHADKTTIYKKLMPLNMANEAGATIWTEIEDEINATKLDTRKSTKSLKSLRRSF